MKTIPQLVQELKNTFSDRKNIAPVESSSTASRAYAVGKKFFYNNILYRCTVAIASGGVITPGTNCVVESDVETQIDNAVAETSSLKETLTNNGAKNLLPNYGITQTINGVTFTVNDDGSVTANGTATANAVFYLIGNAITGLKDFYIEDEVILTGCPSGGGENTYRLRFTEGTPSLVYRTDNGNGVKFKMTSTTTQIWTAIRVANGVTVNNLLFKPMLRLASDPDNTYVPYVMTNKNLMDLLTKKEIPSRTNLGAHNLLPLTLQKLKSINLNVTGSSPRSWSGNSYMANGVTFKVNTDDEGYVTSIVVNGTASVETYFGLTGPMYIPVGTYIMNGTPFQSITNVGCSWRIRTENTPYQFNEDKGGGAEFISAGKNYISWIQVNENRTADNLEFKPMLRLASDPDSIYEPYAKTNRQLTKETTGLISNDFTNGAVNLFPMTKASQVLNGITFTVNDDGTITVNGTSTTSFYLSLYGTLGNRLFDTGVLQKGKSYKISGTPLRKPASVHMYFNTSDETVYDEGNGAIINTSSSTTGGNFAIAIEAANVTLDNVVFKPMITVVDMPNSDYAHYVPYAKSNKELTDENTTIKGTFASSSHPEFDLTNIVVRQYGKVVTINGYARNVSAEAGTVVWLGKASGVSLPPSVIRTVASIAPNPYDPPSKFAYLQVTADTCTVGLTCSTAFSNQTVYLSLSYIVN